MKIADLFFQALLDDGQLKLDAAKSGEAAGQILGRTMSGKLSSALKTTAFAVIAGGAAIAGKGLLELNSIQADFQATTGVSAEEAARAGKAINAMGGRNLQGLKEIGATLTAVYTDLHLTGEAADATAEKFLHYAEVTNQDSTQAVHDFKGILDAWNLTADDAQAIMDKLVVSHQRYGASIADDQAALQTLAPQLQALNLNIDDGIGLLNLFTSAGLDSSVATRALNTAVKNLKPGETFNDLIRQITAIQDPTLRAQKAIQIFGARGGVGLANALKPGITSLDDFKISTTDATGATEHANDVIEGTFSHQVELRIKAIGAAIIGVGQSFGPALTGAAGLFSLLSASGLTGKLSSGIAGAFRAAASSRLVTGAVGFAAGKAATLYLRALYAGDFVVGALRAVWTRVAGSALVTGVVTSAGSVAATLYLRALIAGDALASALSGAWAAVGDAVRGIASRAGAFLGAIYGTAVGVAAEISEFVTEKWRDLAKAIGLKTLAVKAGSLLGAIYGAAVGSAAAIAEHLEAVWATVADSALLGPVIGRAGSIAATLYLKALIFGDAIAGALTAAWGAVTGSAALTAAISAVGTAAFGVMAAAVVAAAAAAPIAIAVLLIPQFQKILDPNDLHGQLNKLTDDLASGKKVYVNAGQQAATAYVQAATQTVATQLGPAINDGLERSRPALQKAASTVVSAVSSSIAAHLPWQHIAREQGNRLAGAVAQGIKDRRAQVDQAWADLLDAIKHQIKPATERAHLLGELASKALIVGLHSKDPEVRAQAAYTKQLIIDRLTELGANAHNIGTKGMEALRKAMHSKDSDIRAAALAIYHAATQPVSKLPAAGTTYGSNFVKNVIAGMNSQQRNLALAAAGLAGIARDHFVLHSPAKVGPWSKLGGPEGWGRRFTAFLVRGIASGMPDLNAALSGRIGVPSLANSVPSMLGLAASSPAAVGAVSPSSVSIGAIHLHGIGSDVSPAAAQRFGQNVLDSVSEGFRQQGARRGIHPAVAP